MVNNFYRKSYMLKCVAIDLGQKMCSIYLHVANYNPIIVLEFSSWLIKSFPKFY